MGNPLTHSTVTGFQKTSDGTAHQAQLDDDLNLKVNVVVGGGGGGGGTLLTPSVGNSTTTPLSAGATFTGTFEDVSHYAAIVIACYSDTGGFNESLKVQWSSDGTNIDEVVLLNGGARGGTGEISYPITIPVGAKFVRVLFTNQLGTGHTAFRLTTYYTTASVTQNPLINLDASADTYTTGRFGPVPLGSAMVSGVNTGSGTIVPIGANSTTASLFTQDANLINSTQKTQLTDGTHLGTIKAASTAAVATDTALVVAQRDPLATTIADGADVTQGNTTDAAIISDANGTLSGKLRGLVKILGNVWDVSTATLRIEQIGPSPQSDVVISDAGTGTEALVLTAAPGATDPGLIVRIAGTPKAIITDGVTNNTLKAASSLPVLTDTALVTTQRDPLPAGTNVIGHVIHDSGSTTVVTGTVTIAGTVTANAGSNLNTSALALDATLTGRTQKAQITDGTRDGTVKAASTLPALTDTAVVTTQRDPLPAGTNVIGHVIHDSGSTTVVTGTVASNITQIGGSTLTIGQQLAAASIPVILPAATVTTLTPPTSVTVTQATPANLNATVTQQTLTKGTQGSTGVSVQQLHDAGRNTRIFMLDAITAAPVAEALATVVQWYGNAAVAGTTTPAVVPAGKTLRLTGYKIQYQSLATVGYAVVRIRVNTAGVAVLASPLVASFEAGSGSGATTAAMTGGVTVETGSFPEGLEIPAAAGIGFSVAGYGPTGTLTLEGGVRFEVHGYEY